MFHVKHRGDGSRMFHVKHAGERWVRCAHLFLKIPEKLLIKPARYDIIVGTTI